MATPVSSRPPDKRYLGNTNTKEVHDLRDERRGCQIDEIVRAGHGVVFSPDSLVQASGEGFDNCAYCIGGSRR
mgnify:CR=1 FL=1